MLIAATCSTFLAMVAYASGGDTITLTGSCGTIEVARDFPTTLIVDAREARIRGLRLSGSNIEWRGGTVSAPGGMDGAAANGYAVKISGKAIRLKGATITNARKGIVIDQASAVTVDRNKFWRLREDGVIVSRTTGLTVTYNTFSETKPRPTSCTTAAGVIYNVPSRNCAGVWVDGSHADAVQMRNGVVNASISYNTVTGPTQGIAQMDTAGDLPLRRVTIFANKIATDGFHRITLTNCFECLIKTNQVRKAAGSAKKAIILPGLAARCGNFAEDEKTQDPPCKS